MLIFKEEFPYTNPLNIVFLCGSKYSPHNENDKRRVLKQYIECQIPNTYAIILEENFGFARTNKEYLSYDEIYLHGLAQVEELASLFANRIIIIHETISTAAEIGMFASAPSLARKICLLVPDTVSVEEDWMGNFIRLSFLNKRSPETQVKCIRYYPDIEVYRLSSNKSDYHTFFHDNQIGKFLGEEIHKFLVPQTKPCNICFRKLSYGKASKGSGHLDYYISKESHRIDVYVHVDALKIQLLSLLFVDGVRKELRSEKLIRNHVSSLFNIYQQVILNTIREMEGQSFPDCKLNIKLKESVCKPKQAIGYFLYMLQAAHLIGLEQASEGNATFRKIRFSTKLDNHKFSIAPLVYASGSTEFGRLSI